MCTILYIFFLLYNVNPTLLVQYKPINTPIYKICPHVKENNKMSTVMIVNIKKRFFCADSHSLQGNLYFHKQ